MPENRKIIDFWKDEAEEERRKNMQLTNRVELLENRLLYLDDDGKFDPWIDGDLKDSASFIIFLIMMVLGTIASVLVIIWVIFNGI